VVEDPFLRSYRQYHQKLQVWPKARHDIRQTNYIWRLYSGSAGVLANTIECVKDPLYSEHEVGIRNSFMHAKTTNCKRLFNSYSILTQLVAKTTYYTITFMEKFDLVVIGAGMYARPMAAAGIE
jgi:hypothetical protein